jgi:hypothetical protein
MTAQIGNVCGLPISLRFAVDQLTQRTEIKELPPQASNKFRTSTSADGPGRPSAGSVGVSTFFCPNRLCMHLPSVNPRCDHRARPCRLATVMLWHQRWQHKPPPTTRRVGLHSMNLECSRVTYQQPVPCIAATATRT